MEKTVTIPITPGFSIVELDRTADELETRRAAISDALKNFVADIKQCGVGYAGVAFGKDIRETMQAAVNDIKFPNQGDRLSDFKHVCLYFEVDEATKMGELAELNQFADAIIPEGVICDKFWQTVSSEKDNKVVAICH